VFELIWSFVMVHVSVEVYVAARINFTLRVTISAKRNISRSVFNGALLT